MRFRLGANLLILAGLSALVAACGGGGGGGATPIAVSVGRNPVLVNHSTTITANFAPYTSANQVKKGSTVTFTVTPAATLSSPTAVTQAGGIATISIKGSQAGTYTISATSGAYAGTTTVAFIPMPATAKVKVAPGQAINNLGALSFNVTNDVPVIFTGYSTLKTASGTLSITNPNALPANDLTLLSAALVSVSGMNVLATSTLFQFSYTIPPTATDIPIFKVDQSSVVAAFTNSSSVKPKPVLTVSPTYYDGAGKVLFP